MWRSAFPCPSDSERLAAAFPARAGAASS
jgi:hypothetical protein